MAESRDKLFENWIKSGMALKYTEEGLLPFVEEVLAHYHETIYKTVLTNSIDKTKCSDCCIQNVVQCPTPQSCGSSAKRCTFHDKNDPTKSYRQCPRNHCNRVKDEIIASHRHGTPSFTNTRSEKWCDSSWELAKCFISNPWYNDKKSVRDVDLTGLINLMLNNREFQLKISANLGDENNPLSKARNVRNEIMHEANLEIPEQKLREYISILSDVLSDPKHIGGQPQAQLSFQKLNELPSMEITVENKDKIRNAIHAAKDHALSEIIEERETSLQFIKEETQKGVQKLKEETQTGLKIIRDEVSKLNITEDDTTINAIRPCEPEEDTTFDEDVERLRQHLIDLYMKTGFCKIAVPPCIHDEEVDIKDIYVEAQFIEATEYSDSDSIWSFLKPNSLLFLSAGPGNGKTALCKKITSSWCKVHTANTQNCVNNETMDLLKTYDLLFNIPSDKIPPTSESLEELIKNTILPPELHNTFDVVIKTKTCLIILDGLEEWYVTEEGKKIPLFDKLPNIACLDNNTLLVTSRQDKLETCNQTLSNFKRIVPFKSYPDFCSVYGKIHTLSNTIHGTITNRSINYNYFIPTDYEPSFSLLVWIAVMMYERRIKFTSALQIYCNVLDFILESAQVHVGDTTETDSITETDDKTQADNFVFPKCLHELQCCQQYKYLVYSVSKLAFNVMFSSYGRNVTMFSASVATQSGLSRKEIEFCLSAGFLIRCKINISKPSLPFTDVLSFPDESFQGFLAALYLHTSTEDSLLPIIIGSLVNLDVVFERTNVILLFCELKPSLMPEIGRHVAALSDIDERVICYRKNDFLWTTSRIKYFNDSKSRRVCVSKLQPQNDILWEIASIQDFKCSTMQRFYYSKLQNAENIVRKIQRLAINCILMSLHEDHEYSIQINDLNTTELIQYVCFRISLFKSGENKGIISFNKILPRIECSRTKTFDMDGSTFDNIIFETVSHNMPDSTIDLKSLWISQPNVLETIRINDNSVEDVSGIIANASSTLKHLVISDVVIHNPYNKAMDDASYLTSIVLQKISISHKDKTNLLSILSTKTELEHLTLEIKKCLTCDGNKSCGEGGLLDISHHSHLRSITLDCVFFKVEFPHHLTHLEIIDLSSVQANTMETVGERLKSSKTIRLFSCHGTQDIHSSPDMSFIRMLISLTTILLSQIKFDQNIFQLSSDMVCLETVDLSNIIMTLNCLEKFISSLPTSNKDLKITLSSLQVLPRKPIRFVAKYLNGVKQFNVSITESRSRADGAIDVTLTTLSLES